MSVTLERPITTTDLLQRLALDITRACQARCTHCYNQSGPQGTAGEMSREDWLSLLDQAAGLGVRQVQFIGGEPTMHSDLAELINRAVDHGMQVEVFSNLIHIKASLWPVLRQRGVTLATSYYSDDARAHEEITKSRGSYRRTRDNIAQAIRYRIPVRAGLVDLADGQRIAQATDELRRLGVTKIRTDRLRGIGRGAGAGGDTHQIAELCGHCARGRAAVLPNGDVAGCVMSGEMLTAGNVRTTPLAEIVTGPAWRDLAAMIPQPRGVAHDGCVPDSCTPQEDSCEPSPGVEPVDVLMTGGCTPDEDSCQPSPSVDARRSRVTACNPGQDGSDCAPAETEACGPAYE